MSIVLLTIAGAVIAIVVGTFWYSNATPMGKLHMKYLGFDTLTPEEQKQKMQEGMKMMPKMYAAQIALSLLTSFAVVFIVTMSVQNGLSFPMALAFVAFNWLCFIVPTIGGALLWSNCDRRIVWQKFFSDAGHNLTTLVLIALLTSLFV
jgi:Na+/citrate or Na+/malate symporter